MTVGWLLFDAWFIGNYELAYDGYLSAPIRPSFDGGIQRALFYNQPEWCWNHQEYGWPTNKNTAFGFGAVPLKWGPLYPIHFSNVINKDSVLQFSGKPHIWASETWSCWNSNMVNFLWYDCKKSPMVQRQQVVFMLYISFTMFAAAVLDERLRRVRVDMDVS